jgi:nitroimidazol reductase NimA-like FMN-containing flavoprotein (pyridoxamine 5'-phosphate oxidase superfamily)
MLQKMKSFLKERDLCVLATCAGGKPHCSLMAYMTDETVETVFMATLRDTQKFKNVSENPQISLLVDDRGDEGCTKADTQALTVSGTFEPMEDPAARGAVLVRMAEKHPHLDGLLKHPEVEVLRIRLEAFLLLQGALEAHFEKVR